MLHVANVSSLGRLAGNMEAFAALGAELLFKTRPDTGTVYGVGAESDRALRSLQATVNKYMTRFPAAVSNYNQVNSTITPAVKSLPVDGKLGEQTLSSYMAASDHATKSSQIRLTKMELAQSSISRADELGNILGLGGAVKPSPAVAKVPAVATPTPEVPSVTVPPPRLVSPETVSGTGGKLAMAGAIGVGAFLLLRKLRG